MEQLKFNELEVSENIRKALDELGFEYATPIQAQSIPFILEGRDVIGLAQTGTGKTLAFGLPILEKIDKNSDKVQVLVLSPTRELALQITNELRKFCAFEEGVRMLTVYGGESIEKQILALKKRPQIVVGTPGRIMDHMRRKTLRLDNIDMVVLDEADEMLNMGFQEDIDTILQDVPETKQMVLFSATFPQELMQIAKTYQNDPITINVRNQEVTVKTIKQCVIETSESNKFEVVSRLIDANTYKLSLIFCNTKKRVDEVAEYLHIHGYRVKALHGDLKQKERDFVMNLFRKGQLDVLIATDVAARGIDVDDIDAVINFDVPQDEAYYVHRIGRTGRAGREGVSYILATNRQKHKLRFIERLTKTPLIPVKIPTVKEIERKRMEVLFAQIREFDANSDLVNTYLPELMNATQMSSEEVNRVLFALLVKERFPNSTESKSDSMEAPVQEGFQRIFLNLGNDHRVSPGTIIRVLAGESGVSGKNFGSIEIYGPYSYVEVPERFAKQLLVISQTVEFGGKTLELSTKLEEHWAEQTEGRKKERSRREDGRREGNRGEGRDRKERSFGDRDRKPREKEFKERKDSKDRGSKERAPRKGKEKDAPIDFSNLFGNKGKKASGSSSRRSSEKPRQSERDFDRDGGRGRRNEKSGKDTSVRNRRFDNL